MCRAPIPVLLLLAACEGSPEPSLCVWTDHEHNPIIEPPGNEFLVGDPAVVLPAESPDGRWHLFANSLLGIHRWTSDDGVDWGLTEEQVIGAGAWRPFVLLDGGTYHLYYERFFDLTRSEIRARTSPDLATWSEPLTILQAELDWEQETNDTIGNPYVTEREGEYWLYYSATGSYLEDTGFYEPRYVGLARASDPLGPYTREPEPLLGPDPADPWRNHGAGSFKLFDETVDGRLVAFNNGIYVADGTSGSAIRVLESDDGLQWETVCDGEPILAPTGQGWKAAFVYAFDSVRWEDDIRLYYNARDGWEVGTERIGMASAYWPPAD
jgi:beta-xylosidase